jgi:capsular polysaccharide biosynthesis protein
MTEQPLDLKSTAEAFRRRKLTLVVLAVIGLIAGAAYAYLRPPLPSATALVLIPTSATSTTGDSTTQINTQMLIATSTPVLEAAGKAVSPVVAALDLKPHVEVSAPSSQILQVKVQAATPERAVQLANAVATQYAQLATTLSGGSLPAPPRVIQTGEAAPVSKNGEVVRTAVIGLVAGLLLGGVIVLARTRRDPRLRLRDEISRALGLPVLGSVSAAERKSVVSWSKLLERYQPSSVDAWNLRRVIFRLLPEEGPGLTKVCVVAMSHDLAALSAGVQTYAFAKRLGIPATLELRDNEALTALRAAATRVLEEQATGRSSGSPATARTTQEVVRPEILPHPKLAVSLVAIDEQHPEIEPFDGVCVLAVSSGFASAEGLARTALAITDAAGAIEGILVVNPEPTDKTTGSLPVSQIPRSVPRVDDQRTPVRITPASGVFP